MTSARSIRVRQKRRRPLLPAGCVVYAHRQYCVEMIYDADAHKVTSITRDENGVALARSVSSWQDLAFNLRIQFAEAAGDAHA